MTARNLFREISRENIDALRRTTSKFSPIALVAIAPFSRRSQLLARHRTDIREALQIRRSIVAKNYHTNGADYPSKLVGHACIHCRAILRSIVAHRGSLIHFGRDPYRGSVTFPEGGGRAAEVVQICGVYKSSSFERSERSSNTYCLLAVAAQLTSLGAQTLRPTDGEGRAKTTGEDRERE